MSGRTRPDLSGDDARAMRRWRAQQHLLTRVSANREAADAVIAANKQRRAKNWAPKIRRAWRWFFRYGMLIAPESVLPPTENRKSRTDAGGSYRCESDQRRWSIPRRIRRHPEQAVRS